MGCQGLNVAVSGARVEDLPSQVERLNELLQNEYKHVQDEWKLLTLFIGANNLCNACTNSGSGNAARFEKNLRAVMQQIQTTVPKVAVVLGATARGC
jgi:lysophospholipase L1-like esterase